jgi:5-methylcytosine-specific restriction endonuclease McrA
MDSTSNTLTAKEWLDILKQYNYKCAYCKRSILDLPDGLVRDHIIPISRGGGNTKENVVPACVRCNKQKSSILIGEVLEINKEVIEK